MESGLLDWVQERDKVGSATLGFNPDGWDATIWILHAMYENPALRSERSNKETFLIGPLGRADCPDGWKRLRWRELAERLGIDPFESKYPPGTLSFPIRSWPANIQPPAEGSLDAAQYRRLVNHLVDAAGEHFTCYAFYAQLWNPRAAGYTIYELQADDLLGLYELDEVRSSPTNLWPLDRSWFVYTDYDLWATKVSGSSNLIERIVNDPELESVPLKF